MILRRVPHIVVVGGGITGAFAAYFLAHLRVGTTLIERDGIGSQASGSNPGGLNPLYGAGIPGPMQDLASESFRLHMENWDSIRSLSGIDFSPRRATRLHIALDERDVVDLERAKEPYDSTPGFSAGWASKEQMLATEPRLGPAILRGLWTEGNARVDAAPYTRAVARSAVRLGARAVRAEAHGLRHRGERVTEVLLDSGPLSCDGVVIASGPWCAEPARWLDTPIPVEPVKGEMLLVKARGGGVRTDFAWRDAAVYGTGGAEVWLGGTEERVGFDRAPSPQARASILERVGRLLSGMRHVRVLRQIAAFRPVTDDGIPIVGVVGGWENVCLAVGAGRKGVLLSAGMGRAAAEIMARGSTQVPIGPCSPERLVAAVDPVG